MGSGSYIRSHSTESKSLRCRSLNGATGIPGGSGSFVGSNPYSGSFVGSGNVSGSHHGLSTTVMLPPRSVVGGPPPSAAGTVTRLAAPVAPLQQPRRAVRRRSFSGTLSSVRDSSGSADERTGSGLRDGGSSLRDEVAADKQRSRGAGVPDETVSAAVLVATTADGHSLTLKQPVASTTPVLDPRAVPNSPQVTASVALPARSTTASHLEAEALRRTATSPMAAQRSLSRSRSTLDVAPAMRVVGMERGRSLSASSRPPAAAAGEPSAGTGFASRSPFIMDASISALPGAVPTHGATAATTPPPTPYLVFNAMSRAASHAAPATPPLSASSTVPNVWRMLAPPAMWPRCQQSNTRSHRSPSPTPGTAQQVVLVDAPRRDMRGRSSLPGPGQEASCMPGRSLSNRSTVVPSSTWSNSTAQGSSHEFKTTPHMPDRYGFTEVGDSAPEAANGRTRENGSAARPSNRNADPLDLETDSRGDSCGTGRESDVTVEVRVASDMKAHAGTQPRSFSKCVSESFDRFDPNKTQRFNLAHVSDCLARMGSTLGLRPVSTEDLERYMQRLDMRGDGHLTKSEFQRLCRTLLLMQRHQDNPTPFGPQVFARRQPGEPADHYDPCAETIVVGSGVGAVCKARCKETGVLRTVRAVDGHRASGSESGIPVEMVAEELDKLRTLDHPCIIPLFEYYVDGAHIYLVADSPEGIKLDKLLLASAGSHAKKQPQPYPVALTEPWIRKMFVQVCEGVAYLHTKGLVHRDLRLDRITLCRLDPPEPVVEDSGLQELFAAGTLPSPESLATQAPEVTDGFCTCKCDVWSMGCCLYAMFLGSRAGHRAPSETLELYPFVPPTDGIAASSEELEFFQRRQLLGPNLAGWQCTASAKELTRLALTFDEEHRPTARGVLAHSWLSQESASEARTTDMS